jgi:hypothetical protein
MENNKKLSSPLFIFDYAFFLFITIFLKIHSYIKFTYCTCKKISTLFQKNKRRKIFIVLHVRNIILYKDKDWFFAEKVGCFYTKKYYYGFKTRTGLLLQDFFEKDTAVLIFLNIHPQEEFIWPKLQGKIESKYRNLYIAIK